MYSEKHVQHKKYRKKRTGRRKATALLVSLIVLIVLVVGTTTAFIIAGDGPITNIFKPSKVSCKVNEESFDGSIKSGVTIENTGDVEAYIRAAIVVTWKNAEGNVYARKPVAGTDYTNLLNADDWFLGDDGFYYYKDPVKAGDSTSVLIYNYTATGTNTPAGYNLNVEILASAIQSVPKDVVEDSWGVTIGDDGTLSKEGGTE